MFDRKRKKGGYRNGLSLLWRRDGGRLSPERIRPALGAGRAQPDYQKAVPEKGRRRSSGESVPLQGVQKDRDRLLNEKSENGLSQRNLKTLCQTFHVNEQWLLTGEGEMMIKRPNASHLPVVSPQFTAILCYYPNIAKAVNQLVERMTLPDWEALNAFLSRNMQEQQGKHVEENPVTTDEE